MIELKRYAKVNMTHVFGDDNCKYDIYEWPTLAIHVEKWFSFN